MTRIALLQKARALVVKVGTGVLTGSGGTLDDGVFESIAHDCAKLAAEGRSVSLVSSGAIGLGWRRLGYPQKPKTMDALQASAAAGQGLLIQRWSDALAPHGRVAAQVLLTHADLADRKRFLNARRALAELTARGAIPVINENDTVSVDEIAFGDNDALSAQVANLVSADLLVMLSVAPALLDGEKRVAEVAPDDASAEKLVRSDKSAGGTGGMMTKVKAARTAAARGTAAMIAAGKEKGVLLRLMAGEDIGTLFWPSAERLASRAHWIAHTLRPRGVLHLDAGAVEAVRQSRRSLLPSGIRDITGSFRQGDAVDLATPDGQVFARGLVVYDAAELKAIRGKRTAEIEAVLGYHLGDEVVHKDDLVLLDSVKETT
ncbi:MAG: glutamate 5-kinase [Myxococcaceae bacterium]